MNREHSIMGASRCVAVNPSDTAPALIALVAERAVRGRAPDDETGQMAGEIAVRGARAPRHNDYKIALMRNLVKRSIRDAS